jgi:hypothetical protein
MSSTTVTVPVWVSVTVPPPRAKIPRGRWKDDADFRRRMVEHVVEGRTLPFGPPHGDVPAADLVHEAMGRLCPYADSNWMHPVLWAVDASPVDAPSGEATPDWSLTGELIRSWFAWNRRKPVSDPFVPPDRDALTACDGVILVLGVLDSPAALHESVLHLRRTGPERPIRAVAFAARDASVLMTCETRALLTFEHDGTVNSAWEYLWKPSAKMW